MSTDALGRGFRHMFWTYFAAIALPQSAATIPRPTTAYSAR